MTTYERLWRARLNVGMTAHRVAERFGVSEITIRKLENGQDPITLEWLERLAPLYGVTVESLQDADA